MTRQQATGCVVITGSSKGIGFALADAFLSQGYAVVLSGRQPEALHTAVQKLQQRYPTHLLHSCCCDVTVHADVSALWQTAVERFQSVAIWINNAGTATSSLAFTELAAHEITQVIETNVIGSMLGAQVALQGMRRQGYGQIFNMQGWGSQGEWSHGMTAYCTSKAAIRYFSDALSREARDSQVQIGTLSPGMVATELLVSSWTQGDPQHWHRMKRLFQFIIDPPEKVATYLAKKIIHNQKAYTHIAWMTPWRLCLRFFQPYYWRRNPLQGTNLDHF